MPARYSRVYFLLVVGIFALVWIQFMTSPLGEGRLPRKASGASLQWRIKHPADSHEHPSDQSAYVQHEEGIAVPQPGPPPSSLIHDSPHPPNDMVLRPPEMLRPERLLRPSPTPSPEAPSPYAYVFYATEDEYACSVLVNIHRLQHLFHTAHRIVVLVTDTVSPPFLDALKNTGAAVHVQQPPPLAKEDVPYYTGCLLKLRAFALHTLDASLARVLVLDADTLVLRDLDHLFALPVVDLAAPRAYWLARDTLTSALLLIALGDRLWQRVEAGLEGVRLHEFDMDLVNRLLGDTVLMLPGSYATLNSHWEDWGVPQWFRPESVEGTAESGDGSEGASRKNEGDKVNSTETEHAAKAGSTMDLRDADGEEGSRSDKRIKRAPTRLSGLHEDSSQEGKTEDTNAPISDKPLSSTSSPTSPHNYSSSSSSLPTTHDTNTDTNKPTPAKAEPTKPHPKPTPHKTHPQPARDSTHPLFHTLFDLYNATNVLHYTAVGKPWTYELAYVADSAPDAHPVLLEQFRVWRQAARDLCPPMTVQYWGGGTREVEIVKEV